MSKNFITEILENDISWYVNGRTVKALDEDSTQHILNCIIEGFSSGELHIVTEKGKQYDGWWEIISWKNIATELYHALKSCKPLTRNQSKAIKRFDENWG